MARLRRKRIYALGVFLIALLVLAFELGLDTAKPRKKEQAFIEPAERPHKLRRIFEEEEQSGAYLGAGGLAEPFGRDEETCSGVGAASQNSLCSKHSDNTGGHQASQEGVRSQDGNAKFEPYKKGSAQSDYWGKRTREVLSVLKQKKPKKDDKERVAKKEKSVALFFDKVKVPAVDMRAEVQSKTKDEAFSATETMLLPGTFIPVSLVSGIDSDLPGLIVARVREAVYDSVTGQSLLLPQGTILTARYDSSLAYSQERVLVVWDALYRQDGFSLELGGMPGVDAEGYAGYKQKVDRHTGRRARGVVLSSLVDVGAWGIADLSSSSSVLERSGLVDPKSPAALLAQGKLASGLAKSAKQMARKKKQDIPKPTLRIAPASSVQVLVSQVLRIPPYADPR